MSNNGNQGGQAFLVRSAKWSYIQYGENAGDGMELYDMEMDPQQFNNLAHFPQYRNIVAQLQENLKAKFKEVRKNDLGIEYKKQN